MALKMVLKILRRLILVSALFWYLLVERYVQTIPYTLENVVGYFGNILVVVSMLWIASMLYNCEAESDHAEEIRHFKNLLQLKDAALGRVKMEKAAERAEASKQLAAKAAVSAELAKLRMEDYQVYHTHLMQMQQTIHNCEETIAWLSQSGAWSAKTPPYCI
jgi:hypothetical protein